MSLQSKLGNFTVTTSATSQSVTTVGFQPKAILFWTGGDQSATAATFSSHQTVAMGCKTAAFESGVFAGYLNNSSSAATIGYQPGNNAFSIVLGTADNVVCRGTVTILSNGFSITWSSTPPNAAVVNYMALAGADLTNATAALIDLSAGDTGAKSYTGASFTPDAAIFLQSGSNGNSHAGFNIGAAASGSKQWGLAINSQGGGASNWAKSTMRTDRVLMMLDNASLDVEASFTAFTSTGFNYSVQTNTSGCHFVVLLLKTGGRFDVGTFDKSPYVAGTDVVTPTFSGGGTVAAVMQACIGKSAGTAVYGDSKIGIGGSDGTNQAYTWSGSLDAQNPSVAQNRFKTSGAGLAVAHPVGQLDAEAIVSFAPNSFTNTWGTNDGFAEQVAWFAFGSANATTATGALTGKKGFFGADGKAGAKGTAAVSSQKPAASVTALVPVTPVSGTGAVASRPASALSGLWVTGSDFVAGEAIAGEFEAGPPDHTITGAVAGKKATVSASAVKGANIGTLVGNKPTVSATGVESFTGTAAVTGRKPSASGATVQAVVSGTVAAAGKKPTTGIVAAETFRGPVVVAAHKPVVAAAGVQGTMRGGVVARKPAVHATGTVALTHFSVAIALADKKPRVSVAVRNIPQSFLLPRAQLGVATR